MAITREESRFIAEHVRQQFVAALLELAEEVDNAPPYESSGVYAEIVRRKAQAVQTQKVKL